MVGICGLCQKNAVLQLSHLIPKWAYRRAAGKKQTGENTPVYIACGNAVLSNKQTTKYLLCADCEQRFSKAEDYMARLTKVRKGRSKLHEGITRQGGLHGVAAALSADVDASQITYFAASIFWRGHVITGACKLGSYEPNFRRYLLGEEELPSEIAISFVLLDPSSNIEAQGWVSEPVSKNTKIGWLHGFLLGGLAFRCLVGKKIPRNWRQLSLSAPSKTKYIAVVKPEECADFLAAAEMARSAKLKGKLATS